MIDYVIQGNEILKWYRDNEGLLGSKYLTLWRGSDTIAVLIGYSFPLVLKQVLLEL